MAQGTDLQSEQFMTLLTDALRAGPGSPEWHQAVGVLRSSGGEPGADEFQMLVRARENLESGRDYRSIKAGPGFTRKVLEAIDQEGPATTSKGLPSANLILLLAAGALIAVVVIVAVVLLKPPADSQAVEELRKVFYNTQVAQAKLDGGAGEAGPEWKLVGEVPLKNVKPNGLTPATTQPSGKDDKREYKAGAIVLGEAIAADQARLVDVTLKIARATDGIIPEVFVAEGPFDDAQAAGQRTLVWQFKGGAARLALGDGAVPVQEEKVDLKKSQVVNVKIKFNKDTVIVDSGDKRLYEGPHKLSPTAQRYVGVRFRRKVGDGSDGVWLSNISVLKP